MSEHRWSIDLTVGEIAAVCDALNWNVAQQAWLRGKRRQDGKLGGEGHKARQRQAERVAERFDDLLREATNNG